MIHPCHKGGKTNTNRLPGTFISTLNLLRTTKEKQKRVKNGVYADLISFIHHHVLLRRNHPHLVFSIREETCCLPIIPTATVGGSVAGKLKAGSGWCGRRHQLSQQKPIGFFLLSARLAPRPIWHGEDMSARAGQTHSGPDLSLSLFISCLACNHPVSAKAAA